MICISVRQSFFACLSCALLTFLVLNASGQTNFYTTNGTEYAIAGALPGDQVYPDLAISTNGGFVVWQDNAIDGNGWGIGASHLNGTLSGSLATFRVNQQATNDQENPRVALLNNKGGAVIVWQGGVEGFQHIYAQFLTSSNTFLTTTDILVSTPSVPNQVTPAVATLNNSNVVVVWGSFNEAAPGSMQDIYAQIFSPKGQKIGTEFLVNEFTNFNQRSPSVAALKTGGFVVAWVSEQERSSATTSGSMSVSDITTNGIVTASVDVYARLYNSNGTPTGDEFLVNDDFKTCAGPNVAAASDGGFMVTWAAHNLVNPDNGWDIYARPFSNAGDGGAVVLVNTHIYGDQYAPRIASIALDYMITWTSLGQDGSLQGVYGQFVHNDGSLTGGELLVNTTTVGAQMHPAVAADGVQQFLTVWTSHANATTGFDLYAQRFGNVTALLQAMPAPLVYAPFTLVNKVYQPQLQVIWSSVQGIAVSNYDVYVDGGTAIKIASTTNAWLMTSANGLKTNSVHFFQVDYVTTSGKRSTISPFGYGKTWSGLNWGGIPYEWMAEYFGGYGNGQYVTTFWPTTNSVFGPNMNLWQVFITGGNPLDPNTWLASQLVQTSQGLFLTWNTQPGATYQVQVSSDFKTWTNLGAPRFAAGITDSIPVGGSSLGYYRLIFLRH